MVKFVERKSDEVEVRCGMQMEAWTVGKQNPVIEWPKNSLKWQNFRERRFRVKV